MAVGIIIGVIILIILIVILLLPKEWINLRLPLRRKQMRPIICGVRHRPSDLDETDVNEFERRMQNIMSSIDGARVSTLQADYDRILNENLRLETENTRLAADVERSKFVIDDDGKSSYDGARVLNFRRRENENL